MTERSSSRTARPSFWPRFRDAEQRHAAMLIVSAVVFIVVLTLALTLSSFAYVGSERLRVGDIASRDILSPAAESYTSEILTESRRQLAGDSASSIYFPPNPDIARAQNALLQEVISEITEIRADETLSEDEKLAELGVVGTVELSDEEAGIILDMEDSVWQAVSAEASNVLERVMRESIREGDLASVRDGLAMQVSVRFNATNAAVVTGLAQDLVRPNRLLNQAATEEARQNAIDAIQPEVRSFEQGQVV
ncbi:MAG: hypothetical protein IAE89_11785, partial [Anaerolineae bacterium]|nr:hypothetical protein [Anaerolineae bacterium]